MNVGTETNVRRERMRDAYQHARRLSVMASLIATVFASFAKPAMAQGSTAVNTDSPCAGRAMQFNDRPPLRFETELDKEKPRFTVTNEYSSPLTAYVVEFPKNEAKPMQGSGLMILDSMTREGMISPVPRDQSLTRGIPHVVGGPIPQPSLVAAVWDDGSTYGPTDVIQKVIESRRASLGAHQEAIELLESGLAQNWNQTQYVTEANNRQRAIMAEMQHSAIRAAPFAGILYTLNQEGLGNDQQQLERTVKSAIEMIVKQRDALESSLCVATPKAARQQRSVQ